MAAESYDRFMGRYSVPLAPHLADLAEVTPGQRALDVGCGPGALTGELVRRLGAGSVAAVDPSPPFIAALQTRYPGVSAQLGVAEHLPFPDQEFDATLAQLVVHFMTDPVAGLAEMRRVTRRRGVVAACVWDHGGGKGPLGTFWAAARRLDPDVDNESGLPGVRQGQLLELFSAAGFEHREDAVLSVSIEHPTFEDWWEPFTLGVGPAGAYTARLEPNRLQRLRELCQEMFSEAAFVVHAQAWAARGTA